MRVKAENREEAVLGENERMFGFFLFGYFSVKRKNDEDDGSVIRS